jgi:hypothetical protein
MAAVTDLAFPDAAVRGGGGHGAELQAAASLVYGSVEIGPDLGLDGLWIFRVVAPTVVTSAVRRYYVSFAS